MIPVDIWLGVRHETRLMIAKLFNLPRTGIVEVSNNRVICDGHSQRDLMLLTRDKIQDYLGSEEDDMMALFDKLVYVLENSISVDLTQTIKKDEPKKTIEESKPEVSSPAEAGTVKAVNSTKARVRKAKKVS